MHSDSAKYSKTTEKDGFDLHWQILALKMLHRSKRSHMCVQMSITALSFSHNHKLIHKTLNNSDTCGAVRFGRPSKVCYQSNTEDTCSILSGSQTASDQSSTSVSLSEALVCRNRCAYRSPQANQQVDKNWLTKAPSGLDPIWPGHSIIMYTQDSEDMRNKIFEIHTEPHVFSYRQTLYSLIHAGLEIKDDTRLF